MYEGSLQDLIDALGRLPGVGPKSAQRLAFHLLQTDSATVENLAKLLLEVKQKVKSCRTCGAVSETEMCNICCWSNCKNFICCMIPLITSSCA